MPVVGQRRSYDKARAGWQRTRVAVSCHLRCSRRPLFAVSDLRPDHSTARLPWHQRARVLQGRQQLSHVVWRSYGLLEPWCLNRASIEFQGRHVQSKLRGPTKAPRQSGSAGYTPWAFLSIDADVHGPLRPQISLSDALARAGPVQDSRRPVCRPGRAWRCSHRRALISCRAQHRSPGCPTTTTVFFDCNAGWNRWEDDWSEAKKVWCCSSCQRGCLGRLLGILRTQRDFVAR